MVRKMTSKKVANSRKARVGKMAQIIEEKHVGYETEDWGSVTNFESAFRDTLRHYGYFYDTKEFFKWGTDWVKKNMTPSKLKHFKAADQWRLSVTAASMARMEMKGADLGDRRKWMIAKIEEVVAYGKSKAKPSIGKARVATNRKSPSELVKEKTNDLIADIEDVVDNWESSSEYSLFAELQKVEAAYISAKAISDYYTPLLVELVELTKKKTPDLVEAYHDMPVRKRTKYLKFIEGLVNDAQKYMDIKKATRKPRAKKMASVSSQVSMVKYLKESKEFKIASIDPSKIIGAMEVWLFNTKYRTLSRLVSSSKTGLTVRRTTIRDVDMEASSKKRISNPEEFLGTIAKATKARVNREYKTLKTKASSTTSQVNADTIILKAF